MLNKNKLPLSPKAWVVGNWKMNPATSVAQQQLTQQLLQLATQPNQLARVQLAVAPTTLHLYATQQLLLGSAIKVVAQDVSQFAGTGAYTGDSSAQQIMDAGVGLTLIGHSERRSLYHEDSAILRDKLKNATEADLTVIFCVGETLAERESGQAEQVVLQQLHDVFDAIDLADWQTKLIIAYEPVWAIGTGKTASPQDAETMHAAIRTGLKTYHSSLIGVPLLYGGSVKPDNAASLAACANIDGALVGGASLDAHSFIQIAQAFADVNSVG